MDNFDGFGLPEALMHTLQHMQFSKPTPIQAQAIPLALAGRDVLGTAQTGTGKTAAFGIPLVTQLMQNQRGSAMVITPTRELATQVMQQLQDMLGKRSKIKTALLIGGESMPRQLQQIRNRPRLYVGTPGRINDHLERGSLMLHDTNFLVLDETDRMLDMGFTVQIERIMKFLPATRQTMLFSATLPKNTEKVAAKYLHKPERVSVSVTSAPAANIEHDIVHVEHGDKPKQLLSELESREGSVIVFMKTKYATEKMAAKLTKAGHSADAIHGNLRQNKRDRVIAGFRNKKHRILVATDVAARGLDIPHIEHVINYDLPHSAEDYIHRIGRTARAGAKGSAVCLLTPADKRQWRIIDRMMNPQADEKAGETSQEKSKPRKPRKLSGHNKRHSGSKEHKASEDGEQRKPRKSFGPKKRYSDGGESRTADGEQRKPRKSFGPKKRHSDGGESRTADGEQRKPRKSFGPKKRHSDGSASKTADGEQRKPRKSFGPKKRYSDGSESRTADGEQRKPRKLSGAHKRRSSGNEQKAQENEQRKPRKSFGSKRGRGKPAAKHGGHKPFKGKRTPKAA